MRTNTFSKKCFFNALLKLYHEKPYAEIQISEICREAGYNRSTFYRIYNSKEQLLLDGFQEEYVKRYYAMIPPLKTGYGEEYIQNVRLLFAFLRQNPDFPLLMRDAHLLNEMFLLFRDVFPYASDRSEEADYTRNFLAAGYLAIIYKWLDDGMKKTDAQMAKLVADTIENVSIYHE